MFICICVCARVIGYLFPYKHAHTQEQIRTYIHTHVHIYFYTEFHLPIDRLSKCFILLFYSYIRNHLEKIPPFISLP